MIRESGDQAQQPLTRDSENSVGCDHGGQCDAEIVAIARKVVSPAISLSQISLTKAVAGYSIG